MNKLIEFFATHPEANEVHEALGRLFTDKEKAQQFIAGVKGQIVVTHTREGINYTKPSDETYHKILQQESVVDAYQVKYEQAPGAEKETMMNAWQKEQQKLAELKNLHQKQLKDEVKDEAIGKQPVADSQNPLAEQTPAPVVEETIAQVVEENPAPVVEETIAQVVEENPAPVVEETIAQVVEETPSDVVEETPRQEKGKGKSHNKNNP